jgi:hypothetical protein
MWTITTVDSELMLWCSDGKPILNVARGGPGESSRLIVDRKGFLDITELNILIDCDLNTTEVQTPSSPSGTALSPYIPIHVAETPC